MFMDDEDERGTYQASALPVAEGPIAGAPTSGAEYLRSVRDEAATCAATVVARTPPPKQSAAQLARSAKKPNWMSGLPEPAEPPPPGLEPPEDWAKQTIAYFQVVRHRMPMALARTSRPMDPVLHIRDKAAWFAYLFGTQAARATLSQALSHAGGCPVTRLWSLESATAGLGHTASAPVAPPDSALPGHAPHLSTLSAIQISDAPTLLAYMVDWLASCSVSPFSPPSSGGLSAAMSNVSLSDQRTIPLLELSPRHTAWAFSLLSVIDTPLSAAGCSTMRALFVALCRLRGMLSHPSDPRVAPVGLLIILSGRVFGQSYPGEM